MKIKKLLKKNEIYFRTVTSLLLGLMAVIVAYNSNRIAKEQTRIAKEQTKINYFENTPDFQLTREYIRDSIGYVNETQITVHKYGGKAKNISIQIQSYAHFEITDKDDNELIRYVHLYEFFDESHRTGENDGSIRYIRGFNNNRNFAQFARRMDAEITKKGYPYVFIKSLIIAKISYTDFLNEAKEEYYDISFGDGVLLRETDFRVNLFKSLKASPESISISKVEEIQKCLDIVLQKDKG